MNLMIWENDRYTHVKLYVNSLFQGQLGPTLHTNFEKRDS